MLSDVIAENRHLTSNFTAVMAKSLNHVQAIRGGRVKLGTITAPEMDYSNEEKGDALHAMEFGAPLTQPQV